MRFRIGIDSGGTFTDVMAVGDDGTVRIVKVPSTPDHPPDAFLQGIEVVFDKLDIDPGDVDAMLHGTTVAINTILQHRFRPIGLVTTRGFKDVLEIARQTIPGQRGAIYTWVKPPRLVSIDHVREVDERVLADGRVLRPVPGDEVHALARWYRDQQIETIAVCLINSYANPAHEVEIGRILKQEYPGCFVSLSSEILPEFREYERAVTTCMNALLMPILGDYLRELRERLTRREITAPLFVMKSAGGVVSADVCADQPIHTALSGPSAAVLGAAWLARQAGFEDLVTFDMGGTSTDVSLVQDGILSMTTESTVDVYPLRAPSVDVVSIGAGGGSIAWLGSTNRIAIGPQSAGAEPGPACYGRGGVQPTVTDANLFLGRIPSHLLEGSFRLDYDLAREAIERFAAQAGMSALAAADGIVEIACFNMSGAVRQVSVQKGRDPRDYALVTLGGAGPLHGPRVAQILGMRRVVVPPNPGIGCALGLLVSDVKDDFVVTDIRSEDQLHAVHLADQFSKLEAQARASLERQQVSAGDVRIDRFADLRYQGMRTELRVSVRAGDFGPEDVEALKDTFHEAHRDAYGYDYRGQQKVELVNLRVSGVGLRTKFEPPPVTNATMPVEHAKTGTRAVYFRKLQGFIECPIYDRSRLRGGHRIEGPAVIEQYDSTTVLWPSQTLDVDRFGNLIIDTITAAISAGRQNEQVLVELVEGAIESAVTEMELMVERTARSTIIREQHDYKAGLFSGRGDIVSSASSAANVDPILTGFPLDQLQDGDVFIWNDPDRAMGGISQLQDVCLTAPVLVDGALVGFSQVFGHVMDIGGMLPGSTILDAVETFQEGVAIPPCKLHDAGVLNRALYDTILANSRFPSDLQGDLDAMIAACRLGSVRLAEPFRRYGQQAAERCFDRMLERCAQALIEIALPQIPDGRHEFEDFVEIAGLGRESREFIRLRLTMVKTRDRITFDFTGSDRQVQAAFNIPADGRYYVKYLSSIFKFMLPDVVMNEGVTRVMEAVVPPGSVFNPGPHAACSNRQWTLFRVPELGMGALAKALRGNSAATSDTRCRWGLRGVDALGHRFVMRDGLGAGSGARPFADGNDCVTANVAGRNMPVEFLEAFYPVLIERSALGQDSGGPGTYRGGLGYDRQALILADAALFVADDRMRLQSWGVNGGLAGRQSIYELNPGNPDTRLLDRKLDNVPVKRGDRIRVRTSGGGGWGSPLDRDPERVRLDVARGHVSPEAARALYGVVLTEDGRVDAVATVARRVELGADSVHRSLIDRGQRFHELAQAGKITLTTEG